MSIEYIDLLFNLLRSNEMFLTFLAVHFHPMDLSGKLEDERGL